MVPLYAPRLVIASTIKNSDMAMKNVPTTDLSKLRVTTTVKATLTAAEMTAPARLMTPPRATPRNPAGPVTVLDSGLRASSKTVADGASKPATSMAGSGMVRARKSSLSRSSDPGRVSAVIELIPSSAPLRGDRGRLLPLKQVAFPQHGVGEHGEAYRRPG